MSPFLFLIEQPIPQQLNQDCHYFSIALNKAREGLGRTWPNPAVGCVVVKDGEILAVARTQDSGRPHAESVALAEAGARAKGATLYVTLEPCCHTGVTGPCTDKIIAAGITRVVYGAQDPDQRVSGGGIAQLQRHKIALSRIADLSLQADAERQIASFAHLRKSGRPQIIAKIATSQDGMIASALGKQTAITGKESQILVHALRAHCDAVMVGAKTVLIDNPQLNVRFGSPERSPWKIVVDSSLKTDPSALLYKNKSVVVHTDSASSKQKLLFESKGIKRIETRSVNGLVDLPDALNQLGIQGFCSILLEGGAQLLHSMLVLNLVDELWHFSGPGIIGAQGVPGWLSNDSKAPAFLTDPVALKIGADYLRVGELQKYPGCG